MNANLKAKQAVVAEVAEVASSALSLVAAEYRGLNVKAMTALRAEARKSGVYLRVVKNSLAKRAVSGTDFECAGEAFVGPLVLAFSKDEPGAAARLLRDFGKENEALVVTLVSIGGELLPGDALERVASLPTREEALAKLMGTMQAPITKLVQTLAAPTGKLVRTLAAVRDDKEE